MGRRPTDNVQKRSKNTWSCRLIVFASISEIEYVILYLTTFL